ncbi:MAG: hypothetical protein Ct9H90mP14_2550 [Methanobacteriota archaeon]|nr:MAG: hypothetical protein Ct9H90mP14_2550 [Euryarchaeota archaeon]
MISGETGEAFQAEIFTGVIFYQRLHHLVSSKLTPEAVASTNLDSTANRGTSPTRWSQVRRNGERFSKFPTVLRW